MTPEELQAALPATMHPYAYALMHPPTNGAGSTPATFEPDEINSFCRHLERLGFRPVEESLDRYDQPATGPIHPHNPGQWRSKKMPEPKRTDPYSHIRAQLAALPGAAQLELLQEVVDAPTTTEPPEEET
ncbi:hypothetical protein [Rhodococcus sp. USK13]|uniref:phage gene 29 protein family protein n=1 Tax=Rhodococcus sp. USK13 TaxID=2806442 RepID=UPI001BCE2842|nr:hypothetical protein [Rhodococcus sp. USK13]